MHINSQRHSRKKSNKSVCFSRSMLRHEGEDIEMIKISLKKELQRKMKLKKLLERYVSITAEQKQNVKDIKAALIEVKDHAKIEKPRIHADPSLYVQSRVKLQIREYLFTLLNTFYKAYEDNHTNSSVIVGIKDNLTYLIKQISFQEDKIYYLQKNQINLQVYSEGQLCTQNNKLKDKLIDKKTIDEQYAIISNQFNTQEQRYQQQLQALKRLQDQVTQLEEQIEKLDQSNIEKQALRKQYHGQVAIELLYQSKMNSEIHEIEQKIHKQQQLRKKYLENMHMRKIRQISQPLRNAVIKQQTDRKIINRSENFQFIDMANSNHNVKKKKKCNEWAGSKSNNWGTHSKSGNWGTYNQSGYLSHSDNFKNYNRHHPIATTQSIFLDTNLTTKKPELLETSDTCFNGKKLRN